MPLENLLILVKKLRGRIDSHGAAFRQNEMLTRYALIDPLLRELGWNTEDPDMVIPEYSSGRGRSDYALCEESKPVIMLEAKSLDTPLKDAVEQVIKYCMYEGTKYSAVTDGRRWEIYEPHNPVHIDEKRIISFDLKDPSVINVCLKVLALWRPAVIADHIAAGQAPISSPPTEQPTPTESPPSRDLDEEGWEPLSEIDPKQKDQPPTGIIFSNDSRIEIDSWISILIEVARWLISNNILDTSHCPIRVSDKANSTRYIVSTQPVHRNDQDFIEPYEMENLYHIEKNFNPEQIVKNTQTIIQYVGKNPSEFKVRFP